MLEFIVKIKDLMSSGLAKIAQTGKNTFAKIQGNIAAAQQSSKLFGASLERLNNDLALAKLKRSVTIVKSEFSSATREVQRLEKEITRMEGRGSRRGTGSFGSGLLSKAASFIAPVAILSMLSHGASASIKAATEFEAQKTSFGVLTGNRSQGNDLANQLRQLKQNSMVGPTVYKNAQTMLGFGVGLDKVLPTMKMLGDISMGDADKLKRLTLAFSEVTAAGQLNGRRMLQFVNAGFNPLQEISRTTGKSMEELVHMMTKGEISASMLENAFKTATSTGGRFNNMMNIMSETTKGKLAIIEGQTQSSMIEIGNRLKPIKEAWAEYKLGLLQLIAPHARLQDSIITEKTSINTLINAITNVNTANDVRLGLLQKLKVTYPELFGNIDIENEKNGELLTKLKDINEQYDKRISLAMRQNNVNDLQQQADSQFKYLVGLSQREENGTSGNLWNAMDIVGSKNLNMMYSSTMKDVALAKGALEAEQTKQRIQNVLAFSSDSDKMKTFTGRGKDLNEFLGIKNKWEFGGGLNSGLTISDLARAEKLMNSNVTAAGIKTNGTSENGKAGGKESVASSITSGGPRVINISGVKFTDKIEIHAANMNEGIDELEHKMEEMFLRILNSGASVQ